MYNSMQMTGKHECIELHVIVKYLTTGYAIHFSLSGIQTVTEEVFEFEFCDD